MFSDIPRVDNWIDDILIWGKNQKEHDETLKQVLNRAKQKHLTLKKKKCKFAQTEIKYVGHIFSKAGLKPDPDKVSAIQDMPEPQSKKDLQRFLGMVNFLGKFFPNMAETTAPLRTLLQKDVEWHWNPEQQSAFQRVKQQLTQTPVLAHYSTDKPVKITADASSVGLGCALLQDDKPVAYASRALTQTEQKYAQIEKETLAIVFACEKFHQNIYGKRCDVESDHKPLENIWNKPLNSCPPRIQRLMLRLQRYDLNIAYKPGKDMHLADTLSRAALPHTDTDVEEEEEVRIHVNMLRQNLTISDKKRQEIREATEKEMQLLKNTILEGWPAHKHEVHKDIRQYFQYNEELSIIDGMIFKADKVVIPPSLRKEMLSRIHEGHLGMEKCKIRGRRLMFWPGMNSQIEQTVAQCNTCIKHRNKQQKEPLKPHDIPDKPWQKVGSDLFHWNDHDYLLIADYYSKFLEIALLHDTKSKTVISHMKSIFARQGIPEEVVSDNGPQYSSEEFKAFAEKWEFVHTTSSPNYPQSNGFAERMVQTAKKILTKSRDSGQDLYLAMLNYRSTPISSTLPSPAELLMNRTFRTRLNILPDSHKKKGKNKIKEKLTKSQDKQKEQYDKHARSLSDLQTNDKVYIQDKGYWKPATVVKPAETPRSYIVQTDKRALRRNRRELLKVSDKHQTDTTVSPELVVGEPQTETNISDKSKHSEKENKPQAQDKDQRVQNTDQTETLQTQAHEKAIYVDTPKTVRSGRVIRRPAWLNEYECD